MMQTVIDIPEETYKNVQMYGTYLNPRDHGTLEKALKAGKPLSKGTWRTVTPIGYKFTGYRCSECNELVYGKTNYCPCCGSYMGAYTRGGCHGNK